MALTINKPAAPPKKKHGTAQAKDVSCLTLADTTRLRVGHLMTMFDVASCTIYRWMDNGKLPPPDGYFTKHPYWLYRSVRELLPKPAQGE